MFFEYRFLKLDGAPFLISSKSSVRCEKNCYAFDYAKELVASCDDEGESLSILLTVGIGDDIKAA